MIRAVGLFRTRDMSHNSLLFTVLDSLGISVYAFAKTVQFACRLLKRIYARGVAVVVRV